MAGFGPAANVSPNPISAPRRVALWSCRDPRHRSLDRSFRWGGHFPGHGRDATRGFRESGATNQDALGGWPICEIFGGWGLGRTAHVVGPVEGRVGAGQRGLLQRGDISGQTAEKIRQIKGRGNPRSNLRRIRANRRGPTGRTDQWREPVPCRCRTNPQCNGIRSSLDEVPGRQGLGSGWGLRARPPLGNMNTTRMETVILTKMHGRSSAKPLLN